MEKVVDNSVISFTAMVREDGRSYDLNVFCKEGLSVEEFADALLALAKDIYTKRFSFDDVKETDAQ